MKHHIDIFVQLGQRLSEFGRDGLSRSVIAQAEAENPWFTEDDVCHSIEAIRSQMLDRSKLEQWLAAYALEPTPSKRVGIIMAGNIPAVGLFDMLCVLVAGHEACVKLSSKDRVVMQYLVDELRAIDPAIAISEWDGRSAVDAVIATGGDSANLHFRTLYGDVPHLLRGSRHSVAVLTGGESDEQLRALASDVFSYSGLGCRNVSLIFAPRGYDFALSVPTLCRGYRNNYRHTRAMLTMQGVTFRDLDGALMVESGAEFPSAISRINIARYDSLSEVEQWLSANDHALQCVVSSQALHPRCVDFGQAQRPRLDDYADGVDVMKFLLSLSHD